jgi:hypothetical protein
MSSLECLGSISGMDIVEKPCGLLSIIGTRNRRKARQKCGTTQA